MNERFFILFCEREENMWQQAISKVNLVNQLRLSRLKVEAQKPLPIFYKDVMLDCGYRLDLIVEDQVNIEVKSVNAIAP